MDPRIREHAQIIVDHSTDVQAGDNVVVAGPAAAEDLAVAVYELLGDRGANPVMLTGGDLTTGSDRAMRAYLRAREEGFEAPDHVEALFEATDVIVRIRGHENATERGDVASETMSDYRQAYQPIQEQMLSSRWCLTQYPVSGSAQLAEMSTEGYQNFVWDAIIKDWDAVREHQQQMVEILDPAEEVHIKSGEDTDVKMSVKDMTTLNDYGENNLPGGEVFTAPVPDSVEGTVLFDKPLMYEGREIRDGYLEFEGGEVVDHDANKNGDLLTELLNTDEGARRLGELGIGMNRDIDEFTYNMLFDEKMGDTVHMAVGRAYGACVPDDQEPNQSAVHVDMIVDMSEDSFIEVDGEIVQRNGTFKFEDGFEA